MRRRDFLQKSIALGVASTIPTLTGALMHSQESKSPVNTGTSPSLPQSAIPVGFVISQGAVVIDFCGPWEVFQDARISGKRGSAFDLYTVAETMQPVRGSAGLRILPDYTFENAPAPKIIVIPAQRGQSDAMLNWIRKANKTADLTMSVCVGANVLAATGLLSGRPATTHHNSYGLFAAKNPDIQVKRGVRFVDDGHIASAGGLSSGIDLALHVVERYLGTEATKETAYYMEYLGEGWRNPGANSLYDQVPVSTLEKPRCIVCSMDVEKHTALTVTLNAKTYYFCSVEHKTAFVRNPKAFLGAA